MDDRINRILERINTRMEQLDQGTMHYHGHQRDGMLECVTIIKRILIAPDDTATARDKRIAEIKSEMAKLQKEALFLLFEESMAPHIN